MAEKKDLLSSLTDAQRQAVSHIDGPLLVLAGPGSGKTRVITYRVAYLIEQGIAPPNILAITFTNKAAEEMRHRLAGLRVPPGCTMCTFHSLAARLLRQFAEKAGLSSNFTIYDEADQKAAMREAIKSCRLDPQNYPPGRMLNRISTHKNDLETPEQIAESEDDFLGKIVTRIYRAYQEQLQANSALDFDDLLMKLALLLRDDPPLRDSLNDRYRYVLVDEYQDTNHCQYQIARGLSLNHNNLCATGDPDQSIYGWRGADIGNILAFESDYPDAKVVRLEENFRSTPQVLALADQLIQFNKRRKHKQLYTARPDGAACALTEYSDEYEEAAGVARTIAQLAAEHIEYRQTAVFYRVNSLSRVLEEAFRSARIPYQIVRGVEFYARRQIKDMIAYLRILLNPSDQVSLQRIINQPPRGIGNTSISRLAKHAAETSRGLWEVLQNVDQVATIRPAAVAKVKQFVGIINEIRSQLDQPVASVMQMVYERSGLAQSLSGPESQDDRANIDELINSAAKYDAETPEGSLLGYLEQIALMSDADAYDEKAGAVSLMTLHAAKGLEFGAVFIVGVEDGLIPHSRSLSTDDDVEEERRLLFVGMTRAKDRLTLSYARNRTVQGAPLATIRSEFVRGLDGLTVNAAADEDDSEFADACDDDLASLEDSADLEYAEQLGAFQPGRWVRHPKLGLGRIQQIMPNRADSRVVVRFSNGHDKMLMLRYAKLQPIDSGA